MSKLGRGRSHQCCFTTLVVNLVAIIISFGMPCARRVSAELIKWIMVQDGIKRGETILLATGLISPKQIFRIIIQMIYEEDDEILYSLKY